MVSLYQQPHTAGGVRLPGNGEVMSHPPIDLSILFQPVTINVDLFLLSSYGFAFKTLSEH